jgi:hypothetical protein
MRCCVWLMEATSPASTSDPNRSATSSAGAASGDFSIAGHLLAFHGKVWPWALITGHRGARARMVVFTGMASARDSQPMGLGC